MAQPSVKPGEILDNELVIVFIFNYLFLVLKNVVREP